MLPKKQHPIHKRHFKLGNCLKQVSCSHLSLLHQRNPTFKKLYLSRIATQTVLDNVDFKLLLSIKYQSGSIEYEHDSTYFKCCNNDGNANNAHVWLKWLLTSWLKVTGLDCDGCVLVERRTLGTLGIDGGRGSWECLSVLISDLFKLEGQASLVCKVWNDVRPSEPPKAPPRIGRPIPAGWFCSWSLVGFQPHTFNASSHGFVDCSWEFISEFIDELFGPS